jgi:hypothetical protein
MCTRFALVPLSFDFGRDCTHKTYDQSVMQNDENQDLRVDLHSNKTKNNERSGLFKDKYESLARTEHEFAYQWRSRPYKVGSGANHCAGQRPGKTGSLRPCEPIEIRIALTDQTEKKKSLDASAYFNPRDVSDFDAFPLPFSRLGPSLLCVSIFLGCPFGTL